VEVDGLPDAVAAEVAEVEVGCREVGALEVLVARDGDEREHLWRIRRDLSYAIRRLAPHKINNDVVVPRGRVPELFALVERLRATHNLRIPSFGHAGDGNIHVNMMIDPTDADEGRTRAPGRRRSVCRRRRARRLDKRRARHRLLEGALPGAGAVGGRDRG
jgi:FAD/FMN-containing dehydrogenase